MMHICWSLIMALGIMLFYQSGGQGAAVIKLPPPAKTGGMALAETLAARRTVRHFASRPLNLAQLSQLLWEADGLSDPRGLGPAPAPRGPHPPAPYRVVGERGVADLPAGVYHYLVADHALTLVAPGDRRAPVARASLHQSWMAEPPVMVVITGEYRRCTGRYGQRGLRYTHMEAGNVSQNLFLAAEALGLGAGIVGAFDDQAVAQVLKLAPAHEPLLVMPVGYKH
jgi:SagB-type dehydrogenase family enzyme